MAYTSVSRPQSALVVINIAFNGALKSDAVQPLAFAAIGPVGGRDTMFMVRRGGSRGRGGSNKGPRAVFVIAHH